MLPKLCRSSVVQFHDTNMMCARWRKMRSSAHRTVKWLENTQQVLDKMESESGECVRSRRGSASTHTCAYLKNYLVHPFQKEGRTVPLKRGVVVLNGPCRVEFLFVIS